MVDRNVVLTNLSLEKDRSLVAVVIGSANKYDRDRQHWNRQHQDVCGTEALTFHRLTYTREFQNDVERGCILHGEQQDLGRLDKNA